MRTLTAAIQFGSSRICAAAAWLDQDGQYEVAAIESVSTDGCIRHGQVVSIADTAVRIKSLMQKLSNRLKSLGYNPVNAAYVGICGMSMRSMEHQPSLVIDETGEVSPELLESLREQSLSLPLQGYDILDLAPCGHYVEDQHLVGLHQLIIADKRLRMGYKQAMDLAKVRIAGFVATPLQLGQILTAEEKQQGVVLIDLGAQLTSVSVYADGALRHLSIIPLGCNTVTSDIASQGLRQLDAENIKQNWSDASPNPDDLSDVAGMACPIPLKELNVIVSSRYEELALNIATQVEKSGLKTNQLASCVLTGGGSMQKGLTALLSKRLDISRISTRSCNSIRYGSSERKPHLASIMSMLACCTKSCEQLPEPEIKYEEPKPAAKPVAKPAPAKPADKPATGATFTRRRAAEGLKGFFGDLFSGLDE